MKEVWNAPATGSGMIRDPAGGFAASAASASDRPGGDDLAAAVDVGAHQVQLGQGVRAPSSVSPPSTADMTVGVSGAGRAHRAAADRGQSHRGRRGSSTPAMAAAASSPTEWPGDRRRRPE